MPGRLDPYEPDRVGWNQIASGPDVLAACLAEAERGATFARSISPRSSEATRAAFGARFGPRDGARYADSFVVEATTVTFRGTPPRAAARITNTAPHAAAVEFGNKATPRGRHILARTAAFLGARA